MPVIQTHEMGSRSRVRSASRITPIVSYRSVTGAGPPTCRTASPAFGKSSIFTARQPSTASMAAADKGMDLIAGPLDPDECQKIDMQWSGDAVTIDFACTMKGKPATAHSAISGSFDSAYTMTVTVQAEDVPVGVRTLTVAGTWLGPCAADQRPGDNIKPAHGARLNILEMIKAKSPRCKGEFVADGF